MNLIVSPPQQGRSLECSSVNKIADRYKFSIRGSKDAL